MRKYLMSLLACMFLLSSLTLFAQPRPQETTPQEGQSSTAKTSKKKAKKEKKAKAKKEKKAKKADKKADEMQH